MAGYAFTYEDFHLIRKRQASLDALGNCFFSHTTIVKQKNEEDSSLLFSVARLENCVIQRSEKIEKNKQNTMGTYFHRLSENAKFKKNKF
ncbi:hypothetical protein KSU1_D0638 [Candidatus Jettenia caeni]|uniref:Uncharacterized protein n=1 Tax=Candidatus Jettenia caeni TaxID=247490 RepID=I3IQF2_9BACT|nr:hypothetical protein [Candidatus Jettenia sp. AMX1]GAB63947.1 hypothetical protein KSU1_D0638 [Candidatus Jettenia caeni]